MIFTICSSTVGLIWTPGGVELDAASNKRLSVTDATRNALFAESPILFLFLTIGLLY